MRRLRQQLTYANVVATLALFVALGGSVYAAATITGKDIRKNSVPGADLKKSSVKGKQLKNRSLGGVELRVNSVTGNEVNEATLEVTRIVARPRFDGSVTVEEIGPGDPLVSVPLTNNAWAAKPGELDGIAGFVGFTPNPACGVSNPFPMVVRFNVGNATMGTAVALPGTTATRIPIAGGAIFPLPDAPGAPGVPEAAEARTVTAQVVSASCQDSPGDPVGTITAVRAGVVGGR